LPWNAVPFSRMLRTLHAGSTLKRRREHSTATPKCAEGRVELLEGDRGINRDITTVQRWEKRERFRFAGTCII